MCWPHVSRNVDKRLKVLKKESKNSNLDKEVKNDICHYQWATSDLELRTNFTSLKEKYTKSENSVKYNKSEIEALEKFFSYMEDQWGPDSDVSDWFQGSNPWNISQNQGIEGLNRHIKKSHTFKTRVSIGKLFEIIDRMLKEWSEKDDQILFKHRLALVDEDRQEGLKILTEGWKWAQKRRKNIDKNQVIKIERSHSLGQYSMYESAGLGKVDRIWVLARTNPKSNSSLSELAKVKLQERSNPSSIPWDKKKEIKESCWVVEESENDFFCDCKEGVKGHLCCHCIGMHYRENTGRLEVSHSVRSLPLHQKRKPGRPTGTGKKKPHCLTKSPPRPTNNRPQLMDESTEQLEEIEEIESVDETSNQPILQTAESVGQWCTLCKEDDEEILSQWKCLECQDLLCDDCKSAHKKNRITREHNISELHIEEPVTEIAMCEPCKYEDLDVEAPFYCQDCDDNLCEDCKNAHKKIKVTRTHIVLENAGDDEEFLLAEDFITRALANVVPTPLDIPYIEDLINNEPTAIPQLDIETIIEETINIEPTVSEIIPTVEPEAVPTVELEAIHTVEPTITEAIPVIPQEKDIIVTVQKPETIKKEKHMLPP